MGDEHRAAEGGRDQAEAAPVLAALSARADAIRIAELARAERQLRGLTTTEREIVDAVTKRLVRALLREPARRLGAAGAERPGYSEAIRHLFALDTGDWRPFGATTTPVREPSADCQRPRSSSKRRAKEGR